MARRSTAIDRDKLRAAIRNLGHEYVFYMLDDAIDLLPMTKLGELAGQYVDLEKLRPDSDRPKKANLLEAAKAFESASLAGKYYESFNVNSKNYREKSPGTTAWIADFRRLLDRCVAQAGKDDPVEVRQAYDILFGLLDHIDECHDDVIFFADEAGSWQVGVDWARVLPPWFEVLAATVSPAEYGERISALLERHYHYGRDAMLEIARKAATPEQGDALVEAESRRAGQQRRGTRS